MLGRALRGLCAVIIAGLLGVTCELLSVTPSFAAGVLDQSQISEDGSLSTDSVIERGQVFTAGITGDMDLIEIHAFTPITNPNPLIMELRDVSSGVPGSTVLYTWTINEGSLPTGSPAWLSLPMSPPVPVTAGTQFAIVGYSAAANRLFWQYTLSDPYPGGDLVVSTDSGASWTTRAWDFTFRTYVIPPPTPTPTATLTPTETLIPTATLTPTATSTSTTTATPSPSSTATPTMTSTITPTALPLVTVTATPTLTATPSATPTSTVAPLPPGLGAATPTLTPMAPPVSHEREQSQPRKTEEQRQQDEHTNASNRDDVYTEGNVLEVIVTDRGTFAIIANRDGSVTVQLNCGTTCPNIQPGDYVQFQGTKENEGFFIADEATVSR